MKLFRLFAIGAIFTLGIVAGLLLAQAQGGGAWQEAPRSALLQVTGPQPRASPADRVGERQIEVYGDRVVLDVAQAQWARFSDTKSMEPVITAGSNAIEVVPGNESQVQVGDIVSYQSEYANGYIIHRVAYKGEDEHGTYFIMKGDNLPTSDPGRVRFSQIKSVVVAIVY